MKAARGRLVVFCLAGLAVLLFGWLDSVRYRTVLLMMEPVDLILCHENGYLTIELFWSDQGDDPLELNRTPVERGEGFPSFLVRHRQEEHFVVRGIAGSYYEDCTHVRVPHWLMLLIYLAVWSIVFVRMVRREKVHAATT